MNFSKMENFSSNQELIKKIEISAEEIAAMQGVTDYWHKILDEGNEDFNGPLFGSNQDIQNLWKQKENLMRVELDTLSDKEKWNASYELKQEAEYEILKDQIDYKNNRLSELMAYIEKQSVWKSKFYTENDGRGRFANQNLDSIYYLTNSGASLRLKKDLFLNNLGKVLQRPDDLFICLNKDCNIIHDIKSQKGQEDLPAEHVSFEPKIGYQVQEYYSNEIRDHQEGGFVSKIKVFKNGDRIIVRNFDGLHTGHIINKVESL